MLGGLRYNGVLTEGQKGAAMGGEFTVTDDVACAAWLTGLHGWPRITAVVPGGFEAYAMLPHPLHPTADEAHDEISWAEAGRRTGIPLPPTWDDRQVQGHVCGWSGVTDPESDAIPGSILRAVAEHAVACGTSDVLLGIWDGFGHVQPGQPGVAPGLFDVTVSNDVGHAYAVLAGPAAALVDDDWLEGAGLGGGFWGPQLPGYVWAADGSWILGCGLDLSLSVLGGPQRLVDLVLGDDRLEAWPADASTKLIRE